MVCRKQPFICLSVDSLEPFVCNNKPFVFFQRVSGFTLTELMVTLTIGAILLTAGAPSLSRFIESNRLATVTNEFIIQVNTARAEAVKRGVPVILCESTSGTACTTTGSWNNGWLAFADVDSSSAWTVGDSMLLVHAAIPGNLSITSAANTVTFNRLGTVDAGNGDYVICNSKIQQKRTITLQSVGQTQLQEGPC